MDFIQTKQNGFSRMFLVQNYEAGTKKEILEAWSSICLWIVEKDAIVVEWALPMDADFISFLQPYSIDSFFEVGRRNLILTNYRFLIPLIYLKK